MSNTPPPDPSHPRVLGDLCRVGTNMPDADFWLIRVHSIDKVGTPVKTFSPEYIGIKVTATDVLVPQYLYYVFMHLQASGAWRQLAKGSQNRVSIRVEDVKRIPLARTNPSVPVGTHPDLFGADETPMMQDLEGEQLAAWARDKKPLDIAKLENAEEVWNALDEGTRQRVLENNTAARAELVTDLIAQKEYHWEYETTGDGGGNTIEYLFHNHRQLSDLAESAMETDEARELLAEPGYAHITAEILQDVLEDTDLYDMGWHSHAEHRNMMGHTKAVGDDAVWPDGIRDDERELDAEESWTSQSGIEHLTLYGLLKRIDFSGPYGQGVTGEGKMLCRELEKHGVYVAESDIKDALERLENGSSYASISFDYSAPDGHFYADVDWDKVREKLDEDHPAPEPEAPAIPVTPRGIDFLMPTHAEMLASGDDEHLKYRFGLWILDKKQWDAERNYQRREITRLKQAQAHKKKMLWPERNPIVMRFPNGSYVAELNPGPNDEDGGTMREESKRMGHCIGQANMNYLRATRAGRMRAFSLRTDEGQSVYTFEAKMGSRIIYDENGKVVGFDDKDKRIDAFPQIKTYKNNLPTGDGVAGRNNANLRVDTMDNLKNAIEFVKSFGVDPSTVPDFYEAKYRHPELFKRENPHHGYGHDDGPKPMYSFDEPWYPRDGDGAGAGAVRQNPEPMYSFDEPWYPRS